MGGALSIFGFLLTRDDWNELDAETRQLFRQMLADEGRPPEFDEATRPLWSEGASPTSYRLKRPRASTVS